MRTKTTVTALFLAGFAGSALMGGAWAGTVPPVVADLSPGRPLHPETWAHLLVEGGFQPVEVHRGPTTFAVVGVRGT